MNTDQLLLSAWCLFRLMLTTDRAMYRYLVWLVYNQRYDNAGNEMTASRQIIRLWRPPGAKPQLSCNQWYYPGHAYEMLLDCLYRRTHQDLWETIFINRKIISDTSIRRWFLSGPFWTIDDDFLQHTSDSLRIAVFLLLVAVTNYTMCGSCQLGSSITLH